MYTSLGEGSSQTRGDAQDAEGTAAAGIRVRARELGFDAVGITRADVPWDEEMQRYEAFLADGMHAGMAYLAEHTEVRRRLDSEHILPGARSVVCLARRYASGPADGTDPSLGEVVPLVARYARGRDYHNFFRKKLRQLAAFIRRLPGEPDARPMCDDVPVLERAWAARAGLGFIGKNGLLIVPGQGSFVLLGEVVTTMALRADSPLGRWGGPSACGDCTLCLEACPTRAFARPFVLDARRCISYWTIEHRGAIPEAVRAELGEHLFGCDQCQSVCPFNASSQRPVRNPEPFRPSEALREATLTSFLAPATVLVPEGSPLKRAGEEGMARNAAIVLGNRGALHSAEAPPEVSRAARSHPSPIVREAASWALRRIEGSS